MGGNQSLTSVWEILVLAISNFGKMMVNSRIYLFCIFLKKLPVQKVLPENWERWRIASVHFITETPGPEAFQWKSRIGCYTALVWLKALLTVASTAFLNACDTAHMPPPLTNTQSDAMLLGQVQRQNLKPPKLWGSCMKLCRCACWSTSNHVLVLDHICNSVLQDSLH